MNLKRLAATAIAVLAWSTYGTGRGNCYRDAEWHDHGWGRFSRFLRHRRCRPHGGCHRPLFIFQYQSVRTPGLPQLKENNGSSYSTARRRKTYNDYADDTWVSLIMTIGGDNLPHCFNAGSYATLQRVRCSIGVGRAQSLALVGQHHPVDRKRVFACRLATHSAAL